MDPGTDSGTEEADEGSTNGSAADLPSRAARWRQRRLDKSDALRAPERTSGEEQLFYIEHNRLLERFRDGWRGFKPFFGGMPSGAGLSGGLLWSDQAVGSFYADPGMPNRIDISASVGASASSYYRVEGELAARNLGGVPINAAGLAHYRRFPEEEFFGLGPDTLEASRTTFLLEDLELGTRVWWSDPRWLKAGAAVSRLDVNVGPGRDDRFPSAGDRFAGARIPGLERQPGFVRTQAFVEIDWRDVPTNPHAGGYYSAIASRYVDQELGAFDFRQYELDLRQYLPFFNGHRVVALRAWTVISEADAGQAVPFFRQPALGGRYALRSFRRGRFRDLNSLLLNAEYWWNAWTALDMAFFFDAGKVTRDQSDLDFTDLETSYGIGLRGNFRDMFLLRWDLAFGSEGPTLQLTFSKPFGLPER